MTKLELPQGLELYMIAARSFGDTAGASIREDVSLLGMGYVVVFIFVMIMLGKFNSVENRAVLSVVGLASIGLGIVTSYGLCLLCGATYGPMHSILPFLMLGIGIDDMFVIVQSLANLNQEEASG